MTAGEAYMMHAVDERRTAVTATRSPARVSTNSLAFALFLMVNVSLLVRPADILPGLKSWPIYQVLLVAAAVMALPKLRSGLSRAALRERPVTVCALGLLFAVALSHLTHGNLTGLVDSGGGMFKTLVYFLVLVTLVDTPARLRKLLLTVGIAVPVIVGLCTADHLGWVEFSAIEHLKQKRGVDHTGAEAFIYRMRGTGLFQDPNDLAQLIVAAGVIGIGFLTERSRGGRQLLWLLPLSVLAVGLVLTGSRGGLLAGGIAALTWLAFARSPRLAIAAALAGLCALPLVSGRLGELNVSSDTGQERILLWRDGLEAIKSADFLFGTGHATYDSIAGLAAHNSFLHAFVELGIFGGTLFFGAFFFAAWGLWRMRHPSVQLRSGMLTHWHACIAAMLAGWCGGMLSLSRCYVPPTFLVLGIAAAYLTLAAAWRVRPHWIIRWDKPHVTRLVGCSVCLLAGFFLFVKVVAR